MRKKFSLIILLFLLSTFHVFPQNNRYAAFGSPVIKYSSLLGQGALYLGGRFGWVINKSIVLGGGFYALANNVRTNYKDNLSNQNLRLGYNFGGLELEYIFFPEYPLHFSVDMLFAGGGLYFSVADLSIPHGNYFSQDLLVWEPSLIIELNTYPWLHAGLIFSYRMITSFRESYGITRKDLGGPEAGIILKFGSY